ncbi:hypothetical protein, partial [Paenibacillus monticola]|uniref:hypothetical protein n=1 Tax=Paenibacillus monticola TaxID=2666075 RepID=UPI001E41B807
LGMPPAFVLSQDQTLQFVLKRAIAHFETSDENLHSLTDKFTQRKRCETHLLLDFTFVKSHSLVVQFSKIKFSLQVITASQQRPL